ncbi:MAG: F0F1 ATP synthase subunit B [Candidatus Magasanikbacteria bacterium]|nr:F0F1 ATP synthase subunit B [Candidatus Magasanikbacteria bacterium]
MYFIDIAYAKAVAETAETVEETGLMASLGLDGRLFIFQLINFAIVAIILWFLVLKPLVKKLAERQKLIDGGLDNAKKAQEQMERSEVDYRAKISEAKKEAQTILEKTKKDAKTLSENLKIKAKQEIENLAEQAKKNILKEKDEMMIGLKGETANLIIAALEKILKEKMTGEKDKKFVEEALKSLK